MKTIVDLIDQVITDFSNESVLKKVGKKVNKMMKDLPLFKV
jgi:glycine hydroxymethyltransferase